MFLRHSGPQAAMAMSWRQHETHKRWHAAGWTMMMALVAAPVEIGAEVLMAVMMAVMAVAMSVVIITIVVVGVAIVTSMIPAMFTLSLFFNTTKFFCEPFFIVTH